VIPSNLAAACRGRASLTVLVLAGCTCPAAPPPARPSAPATCAPATANPSVDTPAPGVPHAVVRRKNYRIEFGACAVEVDPYDGGRIVEFSLDGRSVIVPVEESPEAYASSFWPSPQSAWSWPPPVEFDKLPWKVTLEGNVLRLASATSEKLQLSAQQRLQALPGKNAVSIEFRITNRGTFPRSVAPWQNTRVRPKGITFYPSSEPTYPQSSLKLTPTHGITWYAHDPATVKDSLKSYADGHEGWMAQIDGDLLFVKVFPDVPRDAQAPDEGEIVIYVHNSGRFVEMEQQGPYTRLEPGASLTWPVIFVVRHIPKDVALKPGNQQLVDMARDLVSSVRK
jgi:hypothetical protein